MRSEQDDSPAQPCKGYRARWLSRGLETLIEGFERSPAGPVGPVLDVIIVGSGYGGAVAAAELARHRGDKRVCVLERGRERLPGSFPSEFSDLAGHIRFSTPNSTHSKGRRDGLFDVRIGEDLCALVANGVGGGSLINAGVMTLPLPRVFESPVWPVAIREPSAVADLLATGATLANRLGATRTVETVDTPRPSKFEALRTLAGSHGVRALPITVALADEGVAKVDTPAGGRIDACVGCGNCMTGCNYNAKMSLDVTLLAEARRYGAEIYAGATVLKIEKIPCEDADHLWQVHVVHTDATLRRRQGPPFLLRARQLVISAGTFGSTEILLRSRSDSLRFSSRLGHQLSSNGDLIAAAYDSDVEVNGVGDEQPCVGGTRRAKPVGPTITGMVDLRPADGADEGSRGDAMVIEDLAVPGAFRRLLDEIVTTTAAVQLLAEADTQPHCGEGRDDDPCAIDPEAMKKTLLVAIIGHDSADGVIVFNGGAGGDDGDAAVSVRWPTLRTYPPLLRRHDRFEALSASIGARALPNPLWRFLPDELDYLFGGENGPLLTVHPLGGCPMGDNAAMGVVDDCGRVFDAGSPPGSTPYHQGLVVLDGSIIPTSLGINPALTIASLAMRAVTAFREEWSFDAHEQADEESRRGRDPVGDRPFRRQVCEKTRKPTRVQMVERLSGDVALNGEGLPHTLVHVELTMRFDPVAVADLVAGTGAARLALPPEGGQLRIFSSAPPDDVEASDRAALLVARIAGSLKLFHQERSSSCQRTLRAWSAWFRNRGLRDSVQWTIDRLAGEGPPPVDDKPAWQEAWTRLKSSWDLSSRAGAVRLFEYDLEIGEVLRSSLPEATIAAFAGQRIKGTKRLTYSRRANPWRQLMQVSIDSFPLLREPGASLCLDTGFLARQGMPLMRIVQQEDQPTALADVGALALYVLRMLIHVHVWSFRAPDIPRPRTIQRLPGRVPGLPRPAVHEFQVAAPRNGLPVAVRLTHYPKVTAGTEAPGRAESLKTPILMIHGYSASGTTFAHHSVRPNLATALWERGKDVWIVDLRTSAGMPHAREPWRFEEVAMADIPMAIHQVLLLTGAQKVDIFAHCMGAAMFSMALLGPDISDEPFPDLRRGLHTRIRRLAMSQVAPAVIFTPANVFRAYAMRFLKHYLPISDYEFRPSRTATFVDQLIDRLLATLPYPEDEFDRENPFWTPWRRTPWVGTRHRMDALYGRDFSVNNLPGKVLDYIDDLFGPLNVDTVAQAIHFAYNRVITNHEGFNDYVIPQSLRENCTFPILHIHGEMNGLVSPLTQEHFRRALTNCDARFDGPEAFRTEPFKAGHQDSLIGRAATEVAGKLIDFLERRDPSGAGPGSEADLPATAPRIKFAAQVPAFGVRLGMKDSCGAQKCSLGDHGGLGDMLAVLLVPITEHEGRYLPLAQSGHVEPTDDNLRLLVEWAHANEVWSSREARRWRFDLRKDQGQAALLVLAMYDLSIGLGPAPRHLAAGSLSGLAGGLARKLATQPVRSGGARHPGVTSRPFTSLSDQVLGAIIEAVRCAFENEGSANISQGILHLPGHRAAGPLAPSCFAMASCQYPGGMLDRTPPGVPDQADAGPADASYMRLRALLKSASADVPTRLILTGDQVYADATAGLFDPKVLDDRFRSAYQSFFGARGPRLVLSRLPTVMCLDDHELGDNWEPDPRIDRRDSDDPRALGVRAFFRSQRDVDPCKTNLRLWYEGYLNGYPCFFADSRSRRAARDVLSVETANLLGSDQSRKVNAFLADVAQPCPRFFVSSSMVLPRRLEVKEGTVASVLRSDAWDGYPASLHRLLAGVYRRGLDDMVFLSGDEHISNVATIMIRRAGSEKVVVAHSIHSSALYAPYPFANGSEQDFAGTEEFCFHQRGTMYICSVSTWYPTVGDGFATVKLVPEPHGWCVTVRFHREDGGGTEERTTKQFQIPAGAPTSPQR